jgi:hypothetical protein
MSWRDGLSQGLAGLGVLAIVAGHGAAQTPDVQVRSSVDRTALWVGDRVTYTIELTCKRGVEVLADDVSRDKLKLDGLEVVDATTDRMSDRDGAATYQFRYMLTTYRTDTPVLKIAPLTIRYAVRRVGQRMEDAAPAGDVQAPGATLAFRSVVPDEVDPSGIRSDKPPHARLARFGALRAIGIGLVVISIVPALVAVAALARRTRLPRIHRSVRAVRQEKRASLEMVRAVGVESVERRRETFTKLDALVREHLRDACGVPGLSLTPAEVPFALATSRRQMPAELVSSVLATCELARYGPPHTMPSADACKDTIADVSRIIEA